MVLETKLKLKASWTPQLDNSTLKLKECTKVILYAIVGNGNYIAKYGCMYIPFIPRNVLISAGLLTPVYMLPLPDWDP